MATKTAAHNKPATPYSYAPERSRKKVRAAYLPPAALALVKDIEARELPFTLIYEGDGEAHVKLGHIRPQSEWADELRREVQAGRATAEQYAWVHVFDADLHARYCHGKARDLAQHYAKRQCGWGFNDLVERAKFAERAQEGIERLEAKRDERASGELSDSDQELFDDYEAAVSESEEERLGLKTCGPTADWDHPECVAERAAQAIPWAQLQVDSYESQVEHLSTWHDRLAHPPALEDQSPSEEGIDRELVQEDRLVEQADEARRRLQQAEARLTKARADLAQKQAAHAQALEAVGRPASRGTATESQEPPTTSAKSPEAW
jgi:hypothetical protein